MCKHAMTLTDTCRRASLLQALTPFKNSWLLCYGITKKYPNILQHRKLIKSLYKALQDCPICSAF